MDSGAFTTIERFGGYPNPPSEYIDVVDRFRGCGNLLRVVSQDYMCEPFMLERTGMTTADHQRLTLERYVALRELAGDLIMPVLQGYEPAEYAEHARQYRALGLLPPGTWTGIGSVCKRNGHPSSIAAVIEAVNEAAPGLRLHGFGVKKTSLADARVRDGLYSADSMAWSFSARKQGRDQNDVREAQHYARSIETMAVQENLF